MTTNNTQQPKLGLIVPPAAGLVPVDGPLLYGERAEFLARGLALAEVSTRGYEEVIDAVVDRAAELAQAGAQAVSLMGTSLSFYRGAAFTERIAEEMAQRTGLPCTTMSHAILRGLATLGLRRVAVATAYIDEVNQRLERFLAEHDVETRAMRGLSITGVREVGEVDTATLVRLCEEAWGAAGAGAEGILISCGGLVTLDAIAIVERRLGVPVVSSSPAGFWDLMRTAGQDSRSPRHGRLFQH